MFFKNFRGKLFENGKRYAKSETTIQKALEERIPNHILHVQFERKDAPHGIGAISRIVRSSLYF